MTPPPPRPARPPEWGAAARLLFDHLPAGEAAGRAERFLELIRAGGIAPDGLLVVAGGGRVDGAAFVHVTGGGAATCLPPHAAPGRGAALAALAAATVDRLRADGVRVAQLMLNPDEAAAAAPLEAVGFARTTTLVSLARPAALALGPEPGGADWAVVPTVSRDPRVAEQLLLSYAGSLDCPELNDSRDVGDILGGYDALAADRGGECRWHRLERRGEPAGVLLLGPGASGGVGELAYLGLAPEWRGRGGGTWAVRFAVRDARGRGAEWLLTSVDGRNGPARRLYERHGFRACGEQAVWLWRG